MNGNVLNKEILLEDYTNLRKIGDGGYATVYKVRHNELEYVRAIKVLKEIITSEEDDIYKKFLKECKLLLRLGNGNHPNIVHIFQPLFRSNKAFVEMDYITGEDIKHYVEREKFIPIEDVIQFVKEIGSALAYCHVDIYKYCYDRELDNLEDDPDDGSKVLLDDKTKRRLIEKYKVIHNDIHSGNIMRNDMGHYILIHWTAQSICRHKNDEFISWDEWKQINKTGFECDVIFKRRKNKIILITENQGISIKNVTTLPSDKENIYVALTGDQCALTDIRIR